ncbi:HAUS6 protein, partial [Galbula dea]|nr:HAUS6 protein [Galbula dea]
NITGFQVTALFLFTKLDQRRAAETFRASVFPGGYVLEPAFRKECYNWLKDIAGEERSCIPYISASSLISPGGRKFIHLFYKFARHVMVENIKRKSVGTGIPFAEAVKLRPKDLYMAKARNRVAYNKLVQIFQKEDFVIQEYEKKTKLLIEEIRQIKSEYAVLERQSYRMKQNNQNKKDRAERIQKVRTMWALVMEMLTSLKKQKEVVDSVLEDCADQCILDGSEVVLSIPRLLACRVESNRRRVCTANTYKGEKLNFLTVIQLLNEALRVLRDEHYQFDLEQLLVLENQVTVCNKVQRSMKAKRLAIQQELYLSTSRSISRKQEDWKVKWKSFLGRCPFRIDKTDVFGSQVIVKYQKVHIGTDLWVPELIVSFVSKNFFSPPSSSLPPPLPRISSVPSELTKPSENQEKNLHIETCKGKKTLVPPKILRNEKDESAASEMLNNAGDHVIQREPSVKKEDPNEKAKDELAEEVAKTVMSESPQSNKGKVMPLEDVLSSLAFNPFLTRKQIPRTPENLLTDIRSSWRKAIQTEGSSDVELAPEVVMIEEAPVCARPIMQKMSDSRFMCLIPESPVPDFDPSSSQLSLRKSQRSSTECRPPEQMKINHIIQSPVSETSGMWKSERTEAQELKCFVLNKSSIEDPEEQTLHYVKKSLDTPGVCSENNNRKTILPEDHFQGSLVDGMLHWNASSLLSYMMRDVSSLGILEETLPDELDSIDFSVSVSSESGFGVIDSPCVTGDSKNKQDIKKSTLNLHSLFNTNKVLEKTASKSEEMLHQTHNEGETVRCRSDLSLAPEKRDRDGLSSPVGPFRIDQEFTKTPSPKSVNERKYSLSSVLVSCQRVEEIAAMVHEIPLDLMPKLRGEERLNEKPCTKE